MSEKPRQTFEQASVFPARVFTAEECTPEVAVEMLEMAAARYEKEREDFTIPDSAFERLMPAFRTASVFTLYSSLYTMLFTDTYAPEEQPIMRRKNALVVRLATVQALREKLGNPS